MRLMPLLIHEFDPPTIVGLYMTMRNHEWKAEASQAYRERARFGIIRYQLWVFQKKGRLGEKKCLGPRRVK